MKRSFLLGAVVLAFGLAALAQGTSSGTTTTQSTTTTTKSSTAKAASGSAAPNHLTGCLAKSATGTGYMLTNGRYKNGVAVLTDQDWSAHVGHKVELTGTWQKPTSGGQGGAGSTGKQMRTFNATALKHLAPTCTVGKTSTQGNG